MVNDIPPQQQANISSQHTLKRLFTRRNTIVGVILIAILLSFLLYRFIDSTEKNLPADSVTKKSKLTPNPSPQWKTYEESVKDGDIEPAGKILEVVVHYDATASSQLSIKKLTQLNGYVPKTPPDASAYRIQLLNDNQKVLSEQQFSIPNTIIAETFHQDGKIEGKTVNQSTTDYMQTLQWQDSAASIRILDEKGNQLTSSPFTNLNIIDNKPEFERISGSELINSIKKTSPKLNFNFFIPPVHAQKNKTKNAEKTLALTFLNSGYTNKKKFVADVKLITQGFIQQYEPFKTRASQIAIYTIENTADLGCENKKSADGKGTAIICDYTLAQQQVDNEGTPNDIVIILMSDNDGRATATGRYIVLVNGADASNIFAHEIGHSVGRLLDEYAFWGDTKDGPLDKKIHFYGAAEDEGPGDGNCYADNPPAADWKNQAKKEEYGKICNYRNWYASTKTSVMRDSYNGSPSFNTISQCVLNRRLDELVGPFSGKKVPAKCPSAPSYAQTTSITPVPSGADESTEVSPTPPEVNPSFVCLGSCPTNTPIPNENGVQPTTSIDQNTGTSGVSNKKKKKKKGKKHKKGKKKRR